MHVSSSKGRFGFELLYIAKEYMNKRSCFFRYVLVVLRCTFIG